MTSIKQRDFQTKSPRVDDVVGMHLLVNGRIYSVEDTGKPYVDAVIAEGGFVVRGLNPHTGDWEYVDTSPTATEAASFIKALSRLEPLRVPSPAHVDSWSVAAESLEIVGTTTSSPADALPVRLSPVYCWRGDATAIYLEAPASSESELYLVRESLAVALKYVVRWFERPIRPTPGYELMQIDAGVSPEYMLQSLLNDRLRVVWRKAMDDAELIAETDTAATAARLWQAARASDQNSLEEEIVMLALLTLTRRHGCTSDEEDFFRLYSREHLCQAAEAALKSNWPKLASHSRQDAETKRV